MDADRTTAESSTPVPDIDSLSLGAKVGQLFVAGFDGTTPTPGILDLIEKQCLGGVIYFARNADSPSQVRELSRTLQSRVPDDGPPLLLAVDQEGGRIARFSWGTRLPSAMAFGAVGDSALAARGGKAIGHELRALGVDLNLAPVLDVNSAPANPVIGVRSFGELPGAVADLGAAYARGLQRAGVAACGKHFPGHGDTATDSHLNLPIVNHDRDRLDRVEFTPFRVAIDAGIAAVMTAHVAFPAITGDKRPVTVSQAAVTELLRGELGFDGLVVTDCMEMDAIAEGVGTVEGAVQAIEAGCDLVTVSHTLDRQRAAIAAVVDAVKHDRIPETRIDESVGRVLRAKHTFGTGTVGVEDEWRTAAESCRSVARTVARRSVTLVRDAAGRLPLSTGTADRPVRVYAFGPHRGSPAETGGDDGSTSLADALDAVGFDIESRTLEAGALPEPADDAHTLICTADAPTNSTQSDAVAAFVAAGGDPIVVALRTPYDLAAFPEVSTYLTTYGDTPVSLDAAASVLVGNEPANGTLPVTIPDIGSDDGEAL